MSERRIFILLQYDYFNGYIIGKGTQLKQDLKIVKSVLLWKKEISIVAYVYKVYS